MIAWLLLAVVGTALLALIVTMMICVVKSMSGCTLLLSLLKTEEPTLWEKMRSNGRFNQLKTRIAPAIWVIGGGKGTSNPNIIRCVKQIRQLLLISLICFAVLAFLLSAVLFLVISPT